jgi:hypothetical protein
VRADALAAYRETLRPPTRALLDRYELRDAAVKVVGIGSVGTACWVLLFMAGEGRPPLPAGQGGARLGPGAVRGQERLPEPRQRVVNGYRLMQPASDMFLGWSQGPEAPLLLPPAAGHQDQPPRWRPSASPRWTSTRAGAAGRWRCPTPAPGARPCSAATWARATPSTGHRGLLAAAYADQNEKDHEARLARWARERSPRWMRAMRPHRRASR